MTLIENRKTDQLSQMENAVTHIVKNSSDNNMKENPAKCVTQIGFPRNPAVMNENP